MLLDRVDRVSKAPQEGFKSHREMMATPPPLNGRRNHMLFLFLGLALVVFFMLLAAKAINNE